MPILDYASNVKYPHLIMHIDHYKEFNDITQRELWNCKMCPIKIVLRPTVFYFETLEYRRQSCDKTIYLFI